MIGKKKQPKDSGYTSLGEEITIDDVLSQASTLLDLAAHKALERGNPSEISDVANSFMGLAGVVTNIQLAMNNAAREAQEQTKDGFQTGFTKSDKVKVEDDTNDNSIPSPTSKGDGRL